jgi:hypothetical protein
MMVAPIVNSIWRDADKRFTRYVRVVGINDINGRVLIQTCDATGKVTGRNKTHAAPTRFKHKPSSKGYIFVRVAT